MRARNSGQQRTDAGLNSSDVVVSDSGGFGSVSPARKYVHVTPLASFSSDELAHFRRVSPDIYQALMQYEQLCRQNTAVIEAKETELQRCIDVGQEVLGQLDQMQERCSQLSKERDAALEENKELQRHMKKNEMTAPGSAVRNNGNKRSLLKVEEQPSREVVSLKKKIQESESESAQLREQTKRLEKQLQEQIVLYNTLEEDLQNCVRSARRAGAESEAAVVARRLAEASAAELQRRFEEQGLEVTRSQAAQREAEDALQQLQLKWAAASALHKDSKPVSVEILAAAAQLASLHNQLQDLVIQTVQSYSRKRPISSTAIVKATRMHIPTTTTTSISTTGAMNGEAGDDRSISASQIEHWLLHSMEETARLVPELSNAFQHLEDSLRQQEIEQTQVQSKLQLALDEAQDMGRENMQLRKAFVALKEEMQVLDLETERLRELGNLEIQRKIEQRVAALMEEKRVEQEAIQRDLEQARREGASEAVHLQEKLEKERHSVEQEVRSLRLELSRWRDGENAAASVAACFSRDRGLHDMIEKLESDNQRMRAKASKEMAELQAEVDRLERALQDTRSRYQQQISEEEEEIQHLTRINRELQREKERIDAVVQELTGKLNVLENTRSLHEKCCEEIAQLTAEKDRMIKEQSERAGQANEIALLSEQNAKDETISTLTRQLRSAEIEAAKLQDALHRTSKKCKEIENLTVSIDRYEEVETELMREREHTQSLMLSLASTEAQEKELRSKINECTQTVRDCLFQLPPSTEMQHKQMVPLMLGAARKVNKRILNTLAEQEKQKPHFCSLPSVSPHGEELEFTTPRQFTENMTFSKSLLLPPLRGSSSPALPMAHIPLMQPQRQLVDEKNASQSLSPLTSSVVDGGCRVLGAHNVLNWNEDAMLFSSAMEKLVNDLTKVIDRVLLKPYTHLWEAMRKLQISLSSQVRRLDTTQGELTADDSVSDGGGDINDRAVDGDAAYFGVVLNEIFDSYADASATVFQRLRQHALNYVMELESEYQQSNRSLSVACEEHLRRAYRSSAEHEEERAVQLQSAQTQLLVAQHSAQEAQAMLDTSTARCRELSTHIECLEEKLASKQREWEAERIQWRDSVAELQRDRDTWRQKGDELREGLERQVQELRGELMNAQSQLRGAREEVRRVCRDTEEIKAGMQEEIRRLERELQEARISHEKTGKTLQGICEQQASSNVVLQQKLNDEAVRVRQAEGTIVALQQELRDARGAKQALQRSQSSERKRAKAAEDHSQNLARQSAEYYTRIQELEQRVGELHEAWLVQQKALDAEAQENKALQKVNQALEERVAEIEGDREPLRQQLQSLLLLNPR